MGLCVQLPQNSQLVNQTFLAILGAIRILLRKRLDSKLHLVCHTLSLINSREISLAQFSNGLEHLVKTTLVESLLKHLAPCLCGPTRKE